MFYVSETYVAFFAVIYVHKVHRHDTAHGNFML